MGFMHEVCQGRLNGLRLRLKLLRIKVQKFIYNHQSAKYIKCAGQGVKGSEGKKGRKSTHTMLLFCHSFSLHTTQPNLGIHERLQGQVQGIYVQRQVVRTSYRFMGKKDKETRNFPRLHKLRLYNDPAMRCSESPENQVNKRKARIISPGVWVRSRSPVLSFAQAYRREKKTTTNMWPRVSHSERHRDHDRLIV